MAEVKTGTIVAVRIGNAAKASEQGRTVCGICRPVGRRPSNHAALHAAVTPSAIAVAIDRPTSARGLGSTGRLAGGRTAIREVVVSQTASISVFATTSALQKKGQT